MKTALLSGSANLEIARAVSNLTGIPLTDSGVRKFKNGEIDLAIQESVRGKDVFIMASFFQCENMTINDCLMEFHLIADAAIRAGSKNIYAVLLNYPYARSDQKTEGRSPVGASLVASMLERIACVKRVITFDLHTDQIQGFFQNTGVENLTASKLFAKAIVELNLKDIVVVSPDAGGVKRAEAFKDHLKEVGDMNAEFAMLIKKRLIANEVAAVKLVGDVKGKVAVIIDDICDTGGTLVAVAEELKKKGAKAVYACITHPIFSGDAAQKIKNSVFEKVFVTNTIPNRDKDFEEKIVTISLVPLLADVIRSVKRRRKSSGFSK